MKHILRLDENDIVKILQERFDACNDQVTVISDEDNEGKIKLYVEIEKDEK